ncbi:uncharacterized protein LOC119986977 [Tripterygium wilfordii]|uniref:uncharacterized protein LOC119986977 n=1 Tax=Tripterygium wilfordii TaxID=458696 RepID=UPI0018F84BAF|nr:uncharacterized protein LOC119986977 [Tripterygium wilfordii]
MAFSFFTYKFQWKLNNGNTSRQRFREETPEIRVGWLQKCRRNRPLMRETSSVQSVNKGTWAYNHRPNPQPSLFQHLSIGDGSVILKQRDSERCAFISRLEFSGWPDSNGQEKREIMRCAHSASLWNSSTGKFKASAFCSHPSTSSWSSMSLIVQQFGFCRSSGELEGIKLISLGYNEIAYASSGCCYKKKKKKVILIFLVGELLVNCSIIGMVKLTVLT